MLAFVVTTKNENLVIIMLNWTQSSHYLPSYSLQVIYIKFYRALGK